MSQRNSGYERIKHDAYQTPEWVTKALIPHIRSDIHLIWEPAAGIGRMVDILKQDYKVYSSDILSGDNFIDQGIKRPNADAVITNPPYRYAEEFVTSALLMMSPVKGFVAMLLRCDFDHARTRKTIFADCKAFSKKLILTRRIRWIEGSTGSPSFNHAWFIWDYKHRGRPTLAYDFQ